MGHLATFGGAQCKLPKRRGLPAMSLRQSHKAPDRLPPANPPFLPRKRYGKPPTKKMASTVKYVRVPPNSASLEEARRRVFEFFKTACRSIPRIMEIYNLDDVVSPTQLRSTVAAEIRRNAHLTNSKVIDLLLFKGTEELSNIVEHAKQRHHIIGQYVLGRQGLVQDLGPKDQGTSEFLKNFYRSNYF